MPQSDNSAIRAELQQLRAGLTQIDEHIKRLSRGENFIEFLIMRSDSIKLKMYQEKGHARPHVHVDYGRINHAASYAIAPLVVSKENWTESTIVS